MLLLHLKCTFKKRTFQMESELKWMSERKDEMSSY